MVNADPQLEGSAAPAYDQIRGSYQRLRIAPGGYTELFTPSVIPFFAFPPQIRKIIHTTNTIESVNAQLRKIIKTRGQFPTDESATKRLWLAIRNTTVKWGSATHRWTASIQQFTILYKERFTQAYFYRDPESLAR